MLTVTWDSKEQCVYSLQGVEKLLDDLSAQFVRESSPNLVTVAIENGDSLTIGLGRDVSVLNYVRSDNNPPYFTSVGNEDLGEPVFFYFQGDYSDYPRKNVIPILTARSALTHFCETGRLSELIGWEML